MMVFKRKQIIVLSLVLMIIVAGYLQYSYRKSSVSTAGNDEGKLGEAVYVNGEEASSEDQADKDVVTNAAPASKMANDYFAQAKMQKEATLSSSKESLKQITEDANATKEVKAEAYDKMMAIVDVAQKEANIETLIKKTGISDALVLFGDDGSVDIVAKTPGLSQSQVAQITDIVSRQAKIGMDMIHVRCLY